MATRAPRRRARQRELATLAHAIRTRSRRAEHEEHRRRESPTTLSCSETRTTCPALVKGDSRVNPSLTAAMSARACSTLTPSLSRATTLPATRTSRCIQFPCPVHCPIKTQSGVAPWCRNSGGITPTTVNGRSSSVISLPTIEGSPPKRRCQKPWLRTVRARRPACPPRAGRRGRRAGARASGRSTRRDPCRRSAFGRAPRQRASGATRGRWTSPRSCGSRSAQSRKFGYETVAVLHLGRRPRTSDELLRPVVRQRPQQRRLHDEEVPCSRLSQGQRQPARP